MQPFPVDWRVGRGWDVLRFNVSLLEGLGRVDIGVREWMGLIAYRATGRIDALLPGPASN